MKNTRQELNNYAATSICFLLLLSSGASGNNNNSSNVSMMMATMAPPQEPLNNNSIIMASETSTTVDFTATRIPCEESATTNSCPISEGLACRNGLCHCAYPNLIYNESKKKCYAKVGEPCGFFIGLQNASTASCPENAICALNNLALVRNGHNNPYSVHQCACIYTHYQTHQGSCLPLAKHGESCDERKKCNPESDLICRNATCTCPFKEDQYFDHESQKCVSYAGGNCTRLRHCVPDSICDFWGSGTCQCRLDHRINNGTRTCEPIPPGYLSPCLGEREICNSEAGLKCIDKICQCGNPLHQVYDFQQDACIGLAGDYCSLEESPLGGGGNCVKNAKCVNNTSAEDDVQHPVCSCIPGFSTTPFRKCMKGHLEKCFNEFCNVYRGLACINGSCQCYDSFLKYDPKSQACLSGVGSPCGKIFTPGFSGDWMKSSCPECDSYYFACQSGARCSRDFSQGTEIGTMEKFRCQKISTSLPESTVGGTHT